MTVPMTYADYAPYRALWSSVLLQAFVDLKPRDFRSPFPVVKPSGNKAKDKRRYNELMAMRRNTKQMWDNTRFRARRWIFSSDTHPTSFLWVCECLELDPVYLRKLADDEEGIKKILTGKSL